MVGGIEPENLPQIIRAVIPAAGLGSRMAPLSRVVPKELFPAGHKPMIQHVLEEAVASGLTQICIVIREGKEIIKEYLTRANTVGKEESIPELAALLSECELTFVYQSHPRGLGDALLQARDFVGKDPFVMMIPDQLHCGSSPAALQLMRRFKPGPTIWSSLIKLPKSERPFFVGARGVEYEETESGEVLISRLRTEEETQQAHKGLAYEVRGFGRTIYPPEIFDYLGPSFANPQTGEVDLIKTFEACRRQLRIVGTWLEGAPFDLGTFQSYYRYLPKLWELEENRMRASNANQFGGAHSSTGERNKN